MATGSHRLAHSVGGNHLTDVGDTIDVDHGDGHLLLA
jgi:hypothetical protein